MHNVKRRAAIVLFEQFSNKKHRADYADWVGECHFPDDESTAYFKVTFTLNQAVRYDTSVSHVDSEILKIMQKYMNILNEIIYRNAARRHGKSVFAYGVFEKGAGKTTHLHICIGLPKNFDYSIAMMKYGIRMPTNLSINVCENQAFNKAFEKLLALPMKNQDFANRRKTIERMPTRDKAISGLWYLTKEFYDPQLLFSASWHDVKP